MMEVSKLQVLGDHVLVEGLIGERSDGIVRGITTDDKPEVGLVLKVGPGRFTEYGTFVETQIKPGVLVLFNEHTTTKFNINGKKLYMLREEDVVAYQEHGKKEKAPKRRLP
jgi:chaperonin GroES